MRLLCSNHTTKMVIIFLTLIFQITFSDAATASMIDVANIAPKAYEQDVYGILNHRNLESSPILQKATVIFQTRLSNSTPLQDAALELLKTCKAAEDLSTPQKSPDAVKDAAKSTYAVKGALISLASASVPEPNACKGFGVQSERSNFLNALYGNRGADSQPSLNEHTRCVRELFDNDNSWTSYSNALQDANTLCLVPTLENAQRAILDMLSDMNEIIPAWLQTFGESQKSHLEFMRQQKATATDLSELQRRQREDLEDTHEAAKSVLDTMMAATHSHVDDMTGDLRKELVSANRDVEQMRMAVNNYVVDFLLLKDDQNRVVQQYQSTFTNAVAVQTRSMAKVEDSVRSVVESLNHAYGGFEEQVRAISAHFGMEMREVLQLSDQMKGSQEELRDRQLEAIQHQMEINAFASQIKGDIADMSTAMSSVSGVLGTIGAAWRGELSALESLTAAFAAASVLLLFTGCWRASAISACLGTLLCLLSPIMRTIIDTLGAVTGATGACLVYLGRELFVFAVRILRGAARLASAEFRQFVREPELKAVVIVCLAFIAVYCISWATMIRYHGKKRKYERKLVAASRLASQLSLKKESRALDRYSRAATLPPQRTPQWVV